MDSRIPGAFVIRNTKTQQVLHASENGTKLECARQDEQANRAEQIWWIDIAEGSFTKEMRGDMEFYYTITNMATGLSVCFDSEDSHCPTMDLEDGFTVKSTPKTYPAGIHPLPLLSKHAPEGNGLFWKLIRRNNEEPWASTDVDVEKVSTSIRAYM